MDRSLKWRTIALLFAIVGCVAVMIPTFMGKSELQHIPVLNRVNAINLGLDLQGGLHIVYSIDLDRAVEDRAHQIKRDLDARFVDDKIKATVVTPRAPVGAVYVKLEDASKRAQVEAALKSDYETIIEDIACPAAADGKVDPNQICIRVSSTFAEKTKKEALSNAVTTIRERIDEKGIAEPTVVEKGDQIIVELPGIKKETVQETRDIIARTAKLEFKVVDDGSPYMLKLFQKVGSVKKTGEATDPAALRDGIRAEVDSWKGDESNTTHTDYYLYAFDKTERVTADVAREVNCHAEDTSKGRGRGAASQAAGTVLALISKSRGEAYDAAGTIECKLPGWYLIERYVRELAKSDPTFVVPDTHQLAYELTEPPPEAKDPRTYWRSYYLERAVRLTGSAITNAQPSYDQNTNRPNVSLEFDRYGSRVFGDLTAEIVGKRLATVLDDKVRSAPVIQTAIRGGRASITMGGGDVTRQEREVNELVNVLKTGSLPAPLKEESASTVGPTLGMDAIEKARLSFGLSLVFVVLIMVGVYRWSGWIAVFAVTFHVLVTLAVMALFGATLTLPGIAALVLSVGMCVDGNILINERIRDELLLGKSVRGSIDVGFSRAFSAILDGQFTIAASAWVLMNYGSGPIKGFAIMMLVGVFTTVATNTWVTRILFDWRVARDKNATTLSI